MRVWIPRLLVVLAFAVAVWFARPFLRSPADQALEQHQRLLHCAEQRDWKAALALLAPDYRDAWDQDRAEAIASARDLLRGFLQLNLNWESTEVGVESGTARVRGHLRLEGTGGGPAADLGSALRRLREPFTFTWRKDGWKPGDWRLVSVSQPELAPGDR